MIQKTLNGIAFFGDIATILEGLPNKQALNNLLDSTVNDDLGTIGYAVGGDVGQELAS